MVSSVAVIILNYNGFEDTKECIESIQKYYRKDLKIYLIDNASSDGSDVKLIEYFPQIEIYLLNENRGYAAGNNFGIKKAYNAGYKYFLILNNDTVLKEEILSKLLIPFQEDSQIGIVTCKVLFKDRPYIINSAGGKIIKFIGIRFIRKIGQKDTNILERRYIEFVPGMIMLLKKEVIEIVGYLNENFFMYSEDAEYSIRTNEYFKLYYISDVAILHKGGGGIIGQSYSTLYLYYYTRNRLWISKRNIIHFISMFIISLLSCFYKTYIIIYKNKNLDRKNKILKFNTLWLGFFHGLLYSNTKVVKR